jgi:UDP-N-acetylmuramate--alanine ligase
MLNSTYSQWFLGKIKPVHFVGIGGIGMSGLAEILLTLGFNVQGSDEKSSPGLQRLQSLGAKTYIGHDVEHIRGADVLVYSSAVALSNPEIAKAKELRIPAIRRAALLAELMRLKYGIAIAGAHGKTTTTSLIAVILEKAGIDPTVVVGGNSNNIGANARIGTGPFFVAEADESDETFLMLSPCIAVVTNIDAEHLDHYKDLQHIKDAFSAFLAKIPFFGAAILCGDDPGTMEASRGLDRKRVLYGFDPSNDLTARIIGYSEGTQKFSVAARGESLGIFELEVPGEHMVLNALAAIGVALELGIGPDAIREALKEYRGVKRRLELKGKMNGIVILDDYAHHPTEIRASLKAVRQAYPGPLTLVFQPHRFTRTHFFIEEFAEILSASDRLILLPVYAASESAIPGASSEALAEKCQRRKDIQIDLPSDNQSAVELLLRTIRTGDVVLTMGAGSVYQIADSLVNRISQSS